MEVALRMRAGRPIGRAQLDAVDDAGSAFVSMVTELVPVTRWRFGRLRLPHTVLQFLCAPADEERDAFERFLSAQRALVLERSGGVCDLVDADHPHALAISFPYADGRVATLVLLRSAALGTFTAHERTLLEVAREIGEECLPLGISASRRTPGAKPEAARRAAPAMFVLDTAYRVVMGPGSPSGAPPEERARLPRLIEQEVRRITTGWAADPRSFAHEVSVSLPHMMIRANALHGNDSAYLAVTVESIRVRQVLRRASEAYTITARELEVLAALLDGLRTDEIATRLAISVSTVNDHVKSLIARTKSQNRSQMLARILGWYGAPYKERISRGRAGGNAPGTPVAMP